MSLWDDSGAVPAEEEPAQSRLTSASVAGIIDLVLKSYPWLIWWLWELCAIKWLAITKNKQDFPWEFSWTQQSIFKTCQSISYNFAPNDWGNHRIWLAHIFEMGGEKIKTTNSVGERLCLGNGFEAIRWVRNWRSLFGRPIDFARWEVRLQPGLGWGC